MRKIAAYYGLRRSEVLGLRWDATDLERKTISINHKVIEAEVDGKFIPVGEDVRKTKSSFRNLPLIPAVGKLLLKKKEKACSGHPLQADGGDGGIRTPGRFDPSTDFESKKLFRK